MKSKEEILCNRPLRNVRSQPLFYYDDAIEAMQEYAEQFAIGFAEFAGPRLYIPENKYWVGGIPEFITTDELLELYKQSLIKQP